MADDAKTVVGQAPPVVQSMSVVVDELGPVTLGDAHRYARNLSESERNNIGCRCYRVKCAKDAKCCAGKRIGWSCPVQCGSCLWTPGFYCFFDLCIASLCLCNCVDDDNAGSFACTDMKQNFFAIVPVAEDGKVWGFFSVSKLGRPKDDALSVCIYCEK
jgi:hypothetical protein